MKKLVFLLCVFAFWGLWSSTAQAYPADGFTHYYASPLYNKPWNLPLSARHSGTFSSSEHFWVYSTDEPFEQGNPTNPRVEGYNNGNPPRWTSGVWQYHGDLKCPSGTNNHCVLQLFGADPSIGATSYYMTVRGGDIRKGSVHLLDDVLDEWHRVNLIHDCNNHMCYCYIDNLLKTVTQDNDNGTHPLHYFKFGTYQDDNASNLTETFWANHMYLYASSIPKPNDWWFSSSQENWRAGGGCTAVGWTNGSWPGVAYATQNGSNCYWLGPTEYLPGNSVGAHPCVLVSLYPQSGNSANHTMRLQWITTDDRNWDSNKSTSTVSYTKQNAYTAISLDVNKSSFTSKTINQYRLNFDSNNTATTWIVDYILSQQTFLTGFNSSTDGWSSYKSLSTLSWIGGGYARATQTGNDSILSSSSTDFRGAENDAVEVQLTITGSTTTSHDMQVFWLRSGEGSWSTNCSSSKVNYTANNGQTVTVTVPVGAEPYWWRQRIVRLRLDLDTYAHSQTYTINYIRVIHRTTSY